MQHAQMQGMTYQTDHVILVTCLQTFCGQTVVVGVWGSLHSLDSLHGVLMASLHSSVVHSVGSFGAASNS
jgi:hypothetical protein